MLSRRSSDSARKSHLDPASETARPVKSPPQGGADFPRQEPLQLVDRIDPNNRHERHRPKITAKSRSANKERGDASIRRQHFAFPAQGIHHQSLETREERKVRKNAKSRASRAPRPSRLSDVGDSRDCYVCNDRGIPGRHPDGGK
jgi:hypothetical protein